MKEIILMLSWSLPIYVRWLLVHSWVMWVMSHSQSWVGSPKKYLEQRSRSCMWFVLYIAEDPKIWKWSKIQDQIIWKDNAMWAPQSNCIGSLLITMIDAPCTLRTCQIRNFYLRGRSIHWHIVVIVVLVLWLVLRVTIFTRPWDRVTRKSFGENALL